MTANASESISAIFQKNANLFPGSPFFPYPSPAPEEGKKRDIQKYMILNAWSRIAKHHNVSHY